MGLLLVVIGALSYLVVRLGLCAPFRKRVLENIHPCVWAKQ